MPWSLFFEWWVLSQLFPFFSFTFIKRVLSSNQRWGNFILAFYIFFLALSSPHYWFNSSYSVSHIMYYFLTDTVPFQTPSLIPVLRWSPGEGNGYLLQYSCLENSVEENSMDRGAWWSTVHGVSESDTTQWLTLTHTQHNVLHVCVSITLFTLLFYIYWFFFLTVLCIMWYLSSLTRDWIRV